jgi:hypothetical protein
VILPLYAVCVFVLGLFLVGFYCAVLIDAVLKAPSRSFG